MKNDFEPTHVIFIQHDNGFTLYLPVMAVKPYDLDGGHVILFTEIEWIYGREADWSHIPQQGLLYKGKGISAGWKILV